MQRRQGTSPNPWSRDTPENRALNCPATLGEDGGGKPVKKSTHLAIRHLDGRLLGTADSRQAARDLAARLGTPCYLEWEDDCDLPEVVSHTGSLPNLTEVLEYILCLDPAECERQHDAEVREALRRKYPGGRVSQ